MNRRSLISLIAVICILFTMLSLVGCPNQTNASSDLEAIKEKGKIVVGMECAYAPYNWTTSTAGEHTVPIANNPGAFADGYDVVIAKAIAEGLGVDLEIRAIEWSGLIAALEAGEIDLIIAGMSPTEERKLSIDFQDFAGAKITGQLNTFHYGVIDQINGVVKGVALEDFGALIMALDGGSIDGYVCEKPGAESAVSANDKFTYIEFAEGEGFVCDPAESSISVGLRKGSNLTSEINRILASLDSQKEAMMNAAIARQPVSEE